LKFLLDENVPISIKNDLNNLEYKALSLQNFNKLGIKNGEVAELALKEDAIIITLDSDFLQLQKAVQKKSRIIYIQIHPIDPKKIKKLIKDNLIKYKSNFNHPFILHLGENKTELEKLQL